HQPLRRAGPRPRSYTENRAPGASDVSQRHDRHDRRHGHQICYDRCSGCNRDQRHESVYISRWRETWRGAAYQNLCGHETRRSMVVLLSCMISQRSPRFVTTKVLICLFTPCFTPSGDGYGLMTLITVATATSVVANLMSMSSIVSVVPLRNV